MPYSNSSATRFESPIVKGSLSKDPGQLAEFPNIAIAVDHEDSENRQVFGHQQDDSKYERHLHE